MLGRFNHVTRIDAATTVGPTVTGAIRLAFKDCATVALPEDSENCRRTIKLWPVDLAESGPTNVIFPAGLP